jgi:hypothetical protein
MDFQNLEAFAPVGTPKPIGPRQGGLNMWQGIFFTIKV